MFQIAMSLVTVDVICTFIENIVIVNNCFCTSLYLRVKTSLKRGKPSGEAAKLLFLKCVHSIVGGWSVCNAVIYLFYPESYNNTFPQICQGQTFPIKRF